MKPRVVFTDAGLAWFCVVVALVAGSWGPGRVWAQEAVPGAREKLALFYTAQKALADAYANDDPEAVGRHRAESESYLWEARELFDQADAGSSEQPDVLSDYAQVLNLSREFDLAAVVLKKAVKLKPGDAALWQTLGRSLARLGHPRAREAKRALRKSLALNPTSAIAVNGLRELGKLYHREGLYDFARESYTKALALAPEDEGVQFALATLDVRDGHLRRAADRLEALGGVFALEKDALDESLRDFEAARRWFPDTAEDHVAYAKLLVQANRLRESLLPLERAVRLDPKGYITWNLLGSVSRGLGDLDRAREAFTRSLELNADQPRTKKALDELEESEESSAKP